MSVRKRTWTGKDGPQEMWIVDYVDGAGKRRHKTFRLKKQADTYHAQVKVDIKQGIHTPESASPTIAAAGDKWIATTEANGRERATVAEYRRHIDMHITPFIGKVKLAQLSAPMVRDFEDRLRQEGRSATLVRIVRSSLSMLIADAQERGHVNRNVVKELRRGKERKAERRQKGKLKIGVDIPTRDEIKSFVGACQGRWRPILLTAAFTGLRASELRGLRWQDVDLDKSELHVRQRADRFNVIGRPKSESGERTVPFIPLVLNTLREWKLACPKSGLDLVFPTRKGTIERLSNIIFRGLCPAMITAGVTVSVDDNGKPKLGNGGKPMVKAKYTGMHTLRHFYASWCINRKVDGGLELPAKMVQERLGHSSILMTMDLYGHLFPRGDDAAELAEAERAFFA